VLIRSFESTPWTRRGFGLDSVAHQPLDHLIGIFIGHFQAHHSPLAAFCGDLPGAPPSGVGFEIPQLRSASRVTRRSCAFDSLPGEELQ